MTTSLQTRLRRLETAAGAGGECPRCANTTVIMINGKLGGVSKDGGKLTPEEARAFVAEEEDGRCPMCGQKRQEITVGGWGDTELVRAAESASNGRAYPHEGGVYPP